jgi:tartrate-resistant acid phosphatase type 5
VIGHHTMGSMDTHGDTLELLQAVLPILEVNVVDLYINCHGHCMHHIKYPDSPVHFLTSGGGSKAWRCTKPHINAEEDFSLQFYYDGQGFAAVTMLATEVRIDLYNISGQVMYSMNLQKI